MSILRQIAQLGQPVLRTPAKKVDDPADPDVQKLIDDLLATAAEADGVGIAAPQVFVPLAILIVASRSNPRYPGAPSMEPLAVINPEILWVSDQTEKDWEGCLSIPGLRGLVPRHRRIGVRFQIRGGEWREEEYGGFIARIFQHEIDHLKGTVFVDRVEDTRDLATEKEYRRILAEGRR